ncbi:putative taste receptor type 2 member 33 [Oryctolagus cuniculus]|uniref:putative taste receptor type 2 member 33 n=1 Tax=Oryctolagus cuniculus TaxID=9986 RepID=UPI000491A532|nr:putative taste receptor type 2 member 33 [Oryctolagus cuniculus]
MSSLLSIFSTLVIAGFALGNFANVFIILVNCIDWVKRKKLSSADWILTTLFSKQEIIIVHIFELITNHFNIWLATILSIFYLLKIANFSNFIFFHLKKNINKVILGVLLGSMVILFCIIVIKMEDSMWASEYEGNMTLKTNWIGVAHLTNIPILIIINSIPFATALICLLLLIYSLYKHVRKIQVYSRGFQDPSTKVHVRAMQAVVSFLLLFAIHFLSATVSVWNFNKLQNKIFFSLRLAIAFFFPSSHSFLLILVNRRLSQAFLLTLWQVMYKLKEWMPFTL